ncbi:MAG: SOS response-associated peptidase family protein [Halomonas sp.]|nr:SOS response-associated peptidase family protein [Halomonas sp.]MBL1266592.1 SOS response-associated peptidase family protein [Halomonas sp.]
MTRTWLSIPDAHTFAVAGICRDSDEWGEYYSMVMTDAVGAALEVHSRMPVILQAGDYERWQVGTPEEVKALCVGYADEIAIDRTQDKWRR